MLILAVLIGCLGKIETVDDFETQFALSQCQAYRQCNRMLFDGKYEGMNDCQQSVEQSVREENQTLFMDCNFIAEQATECIQEMNTSTCGDLWVNEQELYSVCHEDVWQCQ